MTATASSVRGSAAGPDCKPAVIDNDMGRVEEALTCELASDTSIATITTRHYHCKRVAIHWEGLAPPRVGHAALWGGARTARVHMRKHQPCRRRRRDSRTVRGGFGGGRSKSST